MPSMSDLYSRELLKLAVAQLALKAGFTSVETEALDVLVDAVGKRIETIGYQAKVQSEQACRTQSNLPDLLEAFENCEPKVDWQSLLALCQTEDGAVPFLSGVPNFPVEKQRGADFGVAAPGHTERLRGAPRHFPPLPEKHAYCATAATVVGAQPAKRSRLEVRKERQAVGTSLSKMVGAQRERYDERASEVVEQEGDRRARETAEILGNANNTAALGS